MQRTARAVRSPAQWDLMGGRDLWTEKSGTFPVSPIRIKSQCNFRVRAHARASETLHRTSCWSSSSSWNGIWSRFLCVLFIFSPSSCYSPAPADHLYPSPGAELASEASLALSDSSVASLQSPEASAPGPFWTWSFASFHPAPPERRHLSCFCLIILCCFPKSELLRPLVEYSFFIKKGVFCGWNVIYYFVFSCVIMESNSCNSFIISCLFGFMNFFFQRSLTDKVVPFNI